jgi:hypothetical protein
MKWRKGLGKSPSQGAQRIKFLTSPDYNFYLPKFSTKSQILKEKEIVKLWSMLPLNLRIKDA